MDKNECHIVECLEQLDFQFNQEEASSIYFISDLNKEIKTHPKIILDLDKAKNFGVDAVYFRFLGSNRQPIPQIYIYNATSKKNEEGFIAELHRNIWSASEIPILLIINDTSINIYDCRRPVEIRNGKLISNPVTYFNLNNLVQYADIVKLYKAQLFDIGSFWESEEADAHFLNNKTAYERLITGLKSVRASLGTQMNISEELSDHLLIICLLIKYLEENGTDEQGVNLAQEFFKQSVGYSTLIDIVKNKKLPNLLEKLCSHFNGGIFELSERSKNELVSANLAILASFLEGTLEEYGQSVLWAEYSFKYIPVELISNFYEEFLPKTGFKSKKQDSGAVYTPAFLVNFLIDECLPLSHETLCSNVKLIDVSCGSGIFLVTAFRRLVQRWRVANMQSGKLADTTPEILKKILKENIFGVDIFKGATELTIFSLNVALCSMLTPKQIWTELRFDDLQKTGNIIKEDFFDYIVKNKNQDFDLIIGNPPFKGLKQDDYKAYENLLKENEEAFSLKIPDNQFALMFLDKVTKLLKPSGLLCLILPAGPLLYNNTLFYRKYFFENYNVPQIIDFTFLRNNIFTANVAVVALFAENRKPDTKDILHLVIKRTKSSKERNYFEIDHYDFHNVPKEIALSNDYIWKTNLVGGGRVFHLIERIEEISNMTLEDFLSKKKEEKFWDYGQGYIVGVQDSNKKADYITNYNTVLDKYFTEEKGIEKIENQPAFYFKDKSRKTLFTPPHLLIKKSIGKKNIPIELRNDYLTFRNEVLAISCPSEETHELKLIEEYFKRYNQLFRFFITATSNRFGVSRTPYTILKEDIDKLPWFEKDISFSYAENILINDVIGYYIDLFAYGENAPINKKYAQNNNQLESYSDIYTKTLNSVYQDKEFQYRLKKIYEGDAFYACEFQFTNEIKEIEYQNTNVNLSIFIDNKDIKNVLIKRIIRIYSQNRIILIKPKQLRYWLDSIALRDADETLNEAFDFN